MAAKPPHQLVDCPPPSWNGGGMQHRQWRNHPACGAKARCVAVLVLVFAAFITGIAFLGNFLDRKFPSGKPVYTVAVTGVTGLVVLSPAAPPSPLDDDYSRPPPPPMPAALSPVFNLTFQIDNTRNGQWEVCVPGLSRADVSYGDAFLAGGSVPPFCAGEKRRSGPVAARAWGQNVAVPQFLRDQLATELAAGDASVDVKVTMTGGEVLSCKPKIGDGTYAACRLDYL